MYKPQINTLDEKHSEIMEQYHINETEVLPKLKQDITILKAKIKTLKVTQIDEFMDIKDAIYKKKRRNKINKKTEK